MKNVLGSPTDFCFAIVLRCSPSNQRGLGYSEGGTILPVAGECVNSECVNRAYKNIFFLLLQFSFNTHYVIASFRLKRNQSSLSSPLLLIELCKKRKELAWERWCKQGREEWGFQILCWSFDP